MSVVMMFAPLRCYKNIKFVNQGFFALGHGGISPGCKSYSKDKGSCCKDVSQTEGKKIEPWPKADPPPPAWRAECPKDPQPPNYDPYRIKVPDVVVPPLPPSNVKPMLECARTRGPCSGKPAPPPPPCPIPPPKPFPWIYVWLLASFCSIVGVIYKLYVWKEEKEKLGEYRPIWRPRRKTKRPYHDKDLPACVQYLIVGAGAAGWAAYRAIMHHDKKAKVFFISKEDCLPYMRPPMSKFMWWNPDPPDLKTLNYIEEGRRKTMYLSECAKFMDPVKFYRKKTGPAVSIATGWCVLRVDADEHVVYVKTMCGEQPVYYERCLLAPGSKAKVHSVFKSAPKGVRDKVSTIRTIRDLEIAYRKVKAAKHVVIIGGGTLGCELAWHLGKMNQLVERAPDEEPIQFVHMFKDKGLMAGVLPEYLGEWAAEKIKCEGVTVMPKTQVYDAFETPDGKLELTLSDGSSLITDYVLVAIGAEPRVEIAEPSFLEQDHINGGFKVNTELEARTHLYVAGDAASFHSQWHDTRLRIEHYDNAEEQGYVAGANMTGYWLPCNMEPHYWLRLGHELEMQVVGEVGACLPTVALFKQCEDEPAMKAQAVDAASGDRPCYKKSEEYQNRYKRGILFYLRDEIVVGMVFWNLPPIEDRKEVVTEMLRARPSYKDINMLAELLGFPETQCTYLPDEQLKDPGPCIKNWRVF
ncbi:apoptosis-inducing factor 1, mitochondrial [Manduca sexta]|uniref:apoptosis-inducing factor 1, mitochondrial n=1 Tax=Manduca sexta TaxID=7130 RepID=UPI00188E2B17|nr:apoptosis-inducing factor 1, mitochondrial [Manduca sexta]